MLVSKQKVGSVQVFCSHDIIVGLSLVMCPTKL